MSLEEKGIGPCVDIEETIPEFLQEVKKILVARNSGNKNVNPHPIGKDAEGFADVISEVCYDPIFRMNRVHEWEKMIIYKAWQDVQFREKLKTGTPDEIRDVLYHLFTDGMKVKLQIPEDVNFHFHFNDDNNIHITIPQHETDHPLGY